MGGLSCIKVSLTDTKEDHCPICNESIVMRPFLDEQDKVMMWQGHCLCERDSDTINVYQVPVRPVSFITMVFGKEGDDD